MAIEIGDMPLVPLVLILYEILHAGINEQYGRRHSPGMYCGEAVTRF